MAFFVTVNTLGDISLIEVVRMLFFLDFLNLNDVSSSVFDLRSINFENIDGILAYNGASLSLFLLFLISLFFIF